MVIFLLNYLKKRGSLTFIGTWSGNQDGKIHFPGLGLQTQVVYRVAEKLVRNKTKK